MERVAFLVESTGERISCLLNPDSVVTKRVAGVRPRRSSGGQLTGAGLTDDPLLYTGGGRTELELDLLFDVNLAGSSISTDDVHDLTRPLWDLAENAPITDAYGRPPLIRFVWGKSWNIPCIVAAVAERAEQFTPAGAPQRSWLRVRLLRCDDSPPQESTPPGELDGMALPPEDLSNLDIPEEDIDVHEIIGGGEFGPAAVETGRGSGEFGPAAVETGGGGRTTERLDLIAYRYYGNSALWRLIAVFNNIDNPLDLKPGTPLRIPPLSELLGAL